MADQTILVTGGTGFAGSHLMEELFAQGVQKIHTTHFGAQNNATQNLDKLEFHNVDLTDRDAVLELFQKVQPTQVYHLASFAAVGKSFDRADALLKNNIALQLNVLEAIRQVSPQTRMLSIGSAEEYGIIAPDKIGQKIDESFPFNPANPYAISKITQELLANTYSFSYNIDIVRARPFNHIGERQSPDFVIPAFVSQIIKIEKGQQSTMKVGSLEAVRDFTDVKDMVKAYILLMEKGQKGEVYNIGSGKGWKISEILDTLIGMAEMEIKVEPDPTRLRPSEVPYFVADNTKITKLGWEPKIPLKETLQRIINEWRTKV
jgi:GDP-4-dehydro-6-deoxy-D-mannose reductase